MVKITPEYNSQINVQYGNEILPQSIKQALLKAGIDSSNAAMDDLSPLDELHLGGKVATLDLARKVKITSDMHLLDVGCGIGGPARTLAHLYKCRVTGLDLTHSFCIAANMLNTLLKVENNVSFFQGNALEMPWKNDSFHMVLNQHFSMNINDKNKLYSEQNRVLNKGGKLVLHEIIAGDAQNPKYPVPWARSPQISFLVGEMKLKGLLAQNGFKEVSWENVSKQALDWYQGMKCAPKPKISPMLIFEDLGIMASNMKQNLKEGRVQVIQAIFEK